MESLVKLFAESTKIYEEIVGMVDNASRDSVVLQGDNLEDINFILGNLKKALYLEKKDIILSAYKIDQADFVIELGTRIYEVKKQANSLANSLLPLMRKDRAKLRPIMLKAKDIIQVVDREVSEVKEIRSTENARAVLVDKMSKLKDKLDKIYGFAVKEKAA